MLSDTHADAERVQIELLRRMTGAGRIARLRSLSSLVIGLSRKAVAKANPQLDEDAVNILWIEHAYGKSLAAKVRNYRPR
ncbi:MAG: hypothetical protein ABFC63_00815 [Thermoguttaceae bacterium]